MRKLPIGIQNFEEIIREGYLYVDKTEYIYRLVHSGKPYFLSRPRRFGKSLFLSTLKAYWEGKKELFEGLKIAELEKDDPHAFEPHPVFYFDFNRDDYSVDGALEEVLDAHLREWEEEYSVGKDGLTLAGRFQQLIKVAYKKTGKRCVVLVDEYDKALLESVPDQRLHEKDKAAYKGFFSTLKSFDEYLEFVFLTGVTKFTKVSIFSDLNHLMDISMRNDYSGICGITDEELHRCFSPEVQEMAEELCISGEECFAGLKKMYDGYHFSQKGDGVYNPFSLLNAFSERQFGSYWFATGTPAFLLKKLTDIHFDASLFTNGMLYASADELRDYRADNTNPVPLFYQTGYLTIKDCMEMGLGSYRYTLGYPNDEVKYGFLNSLAPIYLHAGDNNSGMDIFKINECLKNADTDGLNAAFTALFARLPYADDEKWVERDFQNVIYIVFMLLGQFVHTEIHSSKGRADCILETKDLVYIFEFKRDKSAKEALAQIVDQGYDKPYAADPRRVIKIGVNFNSMERILDGWEVR